MNIPIPQLKKWIAALDSGEYKQTAGRLQDHFGCCCLGIGCLVTIPYSKRKVKDSGFLAGNFTDQQPNAPKWLKRINEDFDIKTGKSLSQLNDWEGYTFPEIATLLELVYIHKILD